MIHIVFIYAKDCKDCRDMKSILEQAMWDSHANGNIDFKEYESEDEKAVDVAIETGIDDIPGCSIGRKLFVGKDSYTYDSMLAAIEEAWNQDTQNLQTRS